MFTGLKFSASVCAVALGAIPGAACAGSFEAQNGPMKACFDAADWNCLLSGYVEEIKTHPADYQCDSNPSEECKLAGVRLANFAIGAVEGKDAAGTLETLDQAISAMDSIRPRVLTNGSQLLLNAIRYDTCKTLADVACVAQTSAAIEAGVSYLEIVIEVSNMIYGETGSVDDAAFDRLEEMIVILDVHYPVSLSAVVREVLQGDVEK